MARRTRKTKPHSSEEETTTPEISEAEEASAKPQAYATRSRVKHVEEIPLPRTNRNPRQRLHSASDAAADHPPDEAADDAAAAPPTNDDPVTPRPSHIAGRGARPHFPGNPPQTVVQGDDDPQQPLLKSKPPRPLPKRVYGGSRNNAPAPSASDTNQTMAGESASSRQPVASGSSMEQVNIFAALFYYFSTLTYTCTGLSPACVRTLRRSGPYFSPATACRFEHPTTPCWLDSPCRKRQRHHFEAGAFHFHCTIHQALIRPATFCSEARPPQGRFISSPKCQPSGTPRPASFSAAQCYSVSTAKRVGPEIIAAGRAIAHPLSARRLCTRGNGSVCIHEPSCSSSFR